MALAGRSPRRSGGGGRRLLIVAVVLTLLVLLIDASIKSRSPVTLQTLGEQAWVDRVLPVVTQSTEQGQQINLIRSGGTQMQAGAITASLNQTASSAMRVYRTVAALKPPPVVAGSNGLLEACLLVRANAAASLAKAMNAELSGARPSVTSDPQLATFVQAGADFQISDRAFVLFTQNLPNVGVHVPSSRWVTNSGEYDSQSLQTFLLTLRNATNSVPVHQLTIVSLSTNPPPVSAAGALQDLPPTSALGVTVVVADTGNQPEPNLTVTASVSPSKGASSVRDFISLTPGQSQALSLGPLAPPLGTPVSLRATVTPASGSSTPGASYAVTIQLTDPNAPGTTTTTLPSQTPSTTTTPPSQTSQPAG